jgi:signal transduction histidine kinase
MSALDWQAVAPSWLRGALLHGLLVIDTELTIRYWNDWLATYSGYSAPEVLGRPLIELYPDLAARGLLECYRRAMAGETLLLPHNAYGYHLPMPAPGRHDLAQMLQDTQISPLRQEGAIVGAITTIADQTGRTLVSDEALRAAEEAVRLRDGFFSIAAHELRTPLTTLLGRAQMLQRWMLKSGDADERSQRTIEIVVAQAQRLNKMITALLDVSRIRTGRFSIEPAPMDLTPLVRRVVEESRLALASHTIMLDGADEPALIEGDEVRLEQVLQNLIGNAIKYSPGGGLVTVRLSTDEGVALVSVSDQGIGISPEAQRRLFHRFYRAQNAESYGISGMGIGLFVVKEVAELHGGQVIVESAEGQGSTFTVRLPLRAGC